VHVRWFIARAVDGCGDLPTQAMASTEAPPMIPITTPLRHHHSMQKQLSVDTAIDKHRQRTRRPRDDDLSTHLSAASMTGHGHHMCVRETGQGVCVCARECGVAHRPQLDINASTLIGQRSIHSSSQMSINAYTPCEHCMREFDCRCCRLCKHSLKVFDLVRALMSTYCV
jgi:hypothetical protein